MLSKDGARYEAIGGGGQAGDEGRSWVEKVLFGPLWIGEAEVFFVLPIVLPDGETELIEFDLLLRAIDAPALGSVEIDVRSVKAPIAVEEDDNGLFQFYVAETAIFDEKLVFEIGIDWQEKDWLSVELIDFAQLVPKGEPLAHFATLTDDSGEDIPIYLNLMESAGTNTELMQASFIFSADKQVAEIASPVELSISTVYILAFLPIDERIEILFDPEGEPVAGDCFTLDTGFEFFGNEVILTEVCAIAVDEGAGGGGGGGGGGGNDANDVPSANYGLEMHFAADENVLLISASDKNCDRPNTLCAGVAGMSNRPMTPESILRVVQYYEELPNGPITFAISRMDFLVGGPWVVDFDVPILE